MPGSRGEMTSIEVVPAVDPPFNYNPPQAPPPYTQITDPSSPPPSYEEVFNKNDGASGADTGVRSTVWTVEQADLVPVSAPPQGRTQQGGHSETRNTQNTSCTCRPTCRRPRIPFTCCPGTKQEREARIIKTCILLYGFLIPVCQLSVVAVNGLDSCWLEEFLPVHQLVAGLTSIVIWGLITVRIFYMERLSTHRVYIESKPTNAQGVVRLLCLPACLFLFAWTAYGFTMIFDTFADFYVTEEAELEVTTAANATTPSSISVTSPSAIWWSTTNGTANTTSTTPVVIIDRRDCSEQVLLVAFCAAVVQLLPVGVIVLFVLGHFLSCKAK